MLIDRPNIVEGSAIQNATVPSGTTFPENPSQGELFNLTTGDVGFYVYNGSVWEKSAKNAEFQAHAGDQTRHLSPEQDAFLDGFMAGGADIKPEDLSRIPEFFTTIENHIEDDQRHLLPEQKVLLDGIVAAGVDFTQIGALNGLADFVGQGQTLAQRLGSLDNAKLNVDGSNVMLGNLNVGGKKVVNVAAPTLATDAANKEYVDNFVQGLHWVGSARTATTANIVLNGLQPIDGVNVQTGDRVLVKNQADTRQNGIWLAHTSAWSRAADYNTVPEVNNSALFILEGATQAKSTWVQLSPIITVGDSPITYTPFSGPVLNSSGPGVILTPGGMASVRQGAGISFNNEELIVDVHAAGGLMLTTDNTGPSLEVGAQLALTKVGTAGTYRIVTTDQHGRVTSGSNPTTLAGYGITDAVTAASLSDPSSSFMIDGGSSYESPTRIVVKRSATTQQIPTTSQLGFGELAVNMTDGKLFMKAMYNGVEAVFQIAAYPASPTSAEGAVIPSEYATLLKYS